MECYIITLIRRFTSINVKNGLQDTLLRTLQLPTGVKKLIGLQVTTQQASSGFQKLMEILAY